MRYAVPYKKPRKPLWSILRFAKVGGVRSEQVEKALQGVISKAIELHQTAGDPLKPARYTAIHRQKRKETVALRRPEELRRFSILDRLVT